MKQATLVLADGTVLTGASFGAPTAVVGEVVFSTAMASYPENLTDPSFRGQILVLTYPLVGNYGVPRAQWEGTLSAVFESGAVQVAGLVVAACREEFSH